MNTPSAEFQLRFLDYLQRIFDEGEFTATYKFALLMALADLSVERGDDSDTELTLTSQEIARKFIGYYDRQARPFPATGGGDEPIVLHQNTGKQARIVNIVREAQAEYVFKVKRAGMRLRSDNRLVADVARTVRDQPLWRLQVLGRDADGFFYPNIGTGHEITLRPGVAYCFRRFHGFVHGLAQNRWVAFIRERRQNLDVLGETVDLGAFLFGSERAVLSAYRTMLVDIQSKCCFYCNEDLKTSEVDHFIPWSRYGTDLGHNFVLACRRCNHDKRDMLADVRHLEHWVRRNEDHGAAMNGYFEEQQLVHDLPGSVMITKWSYQQAENVGAHVWRRGSDTAGLRGSWRRFI